MELELPNLLATDPSPQAPCLAKLHVTLASCNPRHWPSGICALADMKSVIKRYGVFKTRYVLMIPMAPLRQVEPRKQS